MPTPDLDQVHVDNVIKYTHYTVSTIIAVCLLACTCLGLIIKCCGYLPQCLTDLIQHKIFSNGSFYEVAPPSETPQRHHTINREHPLPEDQEDSASHQQQAPSLQPPSQQQQAPSLQPSSHQHQAGAKISISGLNSVGRTVQFYSPFTSDKRKDGHGSSRNSCS